VEQQKLPEFDRQGRRRKPLPKAPPRQRKITPPKDDRTKFDKWLERMREDKSAVLFTFAIPPRDGVGLRETLEIIDVDRYMILVSEIPVKEDETGAIFWVSKSIISAAEPSW
jgi:hypothetical protein